MGVCICVQSVCDSTNFRLCFVSASCSFADKMTQPAFFYLESIVSLRHRLMTLNRLEPIISFQGHLRGI